jgi:uncharacterized membrane protein YccC
MYALNTFLRLVRFIGNSLIGLAVGFVLGLLYASGHTIDLSQYLTSFSTHI